MSETEQILDTFVESQGWTLGTQLDLALTYIENQGSPQAWRDYLSDLAAVDNEMEPASVEVGPTEMLVRGLHAAPPGMPPIEAEIRRRLAEGTDEYEGPQP